MKSFSRDCCRKIKRASSGRKQNFLNEAAYDGLFAMLVDTDVPFPVQKILLPRLNLANKECIIVQRA
jgi:hypothetical protein